MKSFPFHARQSLFLEIGQSSLKAFDGDAGLELPLDRQENGRLTASGQEKLTLSLRAFLEKHHWRPGQRAFCAIGARGVSMRRLTLPASSKEELDQLLLLQIEKEFPLSPDELAWGCGPVHSQNLPRTGASASQELVVVAVKREVFQEYSELLSGCGLSPIFTLGAIARSCLCPESSSSYALLDIGRSHSELISFEHHVPTAIRILPWGGEDITRSIQKNLEISREEAEKLKLNSDQGPMPNGELGQRIQASIQSELKAVAGLIHQNWIGQKLYLSGKSSRLQEIVPSLSSAFRDPVECERLDSLSGEGRSAAILGLQRSLERNGGSPPFVLQVKPTKVDESKARPAVWPWALLACLLAVGSLSFRYVEAFLWKPRLAKRLSELKSSREGLPKLDRELGFLQYIETNQPPYLNAISILANAAAPGTRIESLAMSRRGDLSLRGKMQNSEQATQFRSKLIDSGFFSTVVLEEQTPTPDRQVAVRITAQWKPGSVRESPEALRREPEKPKGPGNGSKTNTPPN